MLDIRKKDDQFKVGDVIEVSMSIEYQIPPEDEDELEIDLNKYAVSYDMYWKYPREMGCLGDEFTLEPGCCTSFDDNIKQYIEQTCAEELDEIKEYELFDVDDKGEFQKAKLRILSLK